MSGTLHKLVVVIPLTRDRFAMKKLTVFVIAVFLLSAFVLSTTACDKTRSARGGADNAGGQDLYGGSRSAGSSPVKKFALVIGNGSYTQISKLNNPVNDANDISAVLSELGFTVDKVLDGSLEQMENAVGRLRNRLSEEQSSYGFFFYAGHGVQSNGENYLIPVDANIQSESNLRLRTVSVSAMLDDLNGAGNELNVVVLDACRDNPFGWNRSGSRGLTIVGNQPADSIIVYATSAGQTAADGTGRNGLFTGHLLNNLKFPGIEVKEVFNRTGADVANASSRRQIPAVYNQFFGTAYLGSAPAPQTPAVTQEPAAAPAVTQTPAVSQNPEDGFETGPVSIARGSLEISTITAGTVTINGGQVNRQVALPDWGTLPIARVNAGAYRVSIRYKDGNTEEKTVEVGRDESKKVEFSYRPAAQAAQTTENKGTESREQAR